MHFYSFVNRHNAYFSKKYDIFDADFNFAAFLPPARKFSPVTAGFFRNCTPPAVRISAVKKFLEISVFLLTKTYEQYII